AASNAAVKREKEWPTCETSQQVRRHGSGVARSPRGGASRSRSRARHRSRVMHVTLLIVGLREAPALASLPVVRVLPSHRTVGIFRKGGVFDMFRPSGRFGLSGKVCRVSLTCRANSALFLPQALDFFLGFAGDGGVGIVAHQDLPGLDGLVAQTKAFQSLGLGGEELDLVG